jgi:hypothetical protein
MQISSAYFKAGVKPAFFSIFLLFKSLMMKYLCLFVYLTTGLISYSFSQDTLYYDIHWNLCEPYKALFYRTATVDREKICFHGTVKDFAVRSHRLLMEGAYVNGSKQGLFTFYYLNGQVESTGHYAGNQKQGQWKYFYVSGQPQKMLAFSDDGTVRFQSLQDSLGNFLVTGGNGVWWETDIEAVSKAPVVLEGKVVNGLREGKWQVTYPNGDILLEEHFTQGKFNYGEVWENKMSRRYYDSRLSLSDYAELTKPEYFAYNEAEMDKAYYGQGLFYFLHLFLNTPYYPETHLNNYQTVQQVAGKCAEGKLLAAYPDGPAAYYRFLRKWQATTAIPGDESGLILIQAKITPYGTVKNYYIAKGLNPSQNRRALELVKKMQWIPAFCNFRAVSSYKRIAVYY